MELLDLDRERTTWQGLLALTKPLVATGIKSAVKTLQILSGEDSILGKSVPGYLQIGPPLFSLRERLSKD